MTAIITSQFRLNMAKELIGNIRDNSTSYYLFTGRSEQWLPSDTSPDTPYDNLYSTHYDAHQKMQSLKLIADNEVSFAAPRYQWISGTTYSEFDDRDPLLAAAKYFVISDNNNVFICLKSGGTSTVNPDITGIKTSGVIDQTASDGYIWKYLYTLDSAAATKFLTSSFIPVDFITTSPPAGSSQALVNQYAVQQNAKIGAIYNIKVTTGGAGYSVVPILTIEGDGTGATATAVLTGGVITGVTVTNPGQNYTQANIVITTGTPTTDGVVRPVLGPIGGFGADSRNDLRAHFVAVNTTLTYDEGGVFVINNDFRQIGIVKNPFNIGGTTVATAAALSATKNMTVGVTNAFYHDDEIEGLTSGAKAIVDYYTSTAGSIWQGKIRYHQTEETGFKSFVASENVRKVGTAVAGSTITNFTNPATITNVHPYTGDVIFLENRTAVSRSVDQIETIKLVLEL
jgi:hypothetical protein